MKFVEGNLVHPKVRPTADLLVFLVMIVAKKITRKTVDSVFFIAPQRLSNMKKQTIFTTSCWHFSVICNGKEFKADSGVHDLHDWYYEYFDYIRALESILITNKYSNNWEIVGVYNDTYWYMLDMSKPDLYIINFASWVYKQSRFKTDLLHVNVML